MLALQVSLFLQAEHTAYGQRPQKMLFTNICNGTERKTVIEEICGK